MLLRFIRKCIKELVDFKENAETYKEGQEWPCVVLQNQLCWSFSYFWERCRAGAASLSTVFMGTWLLILLQGRARETALKKRQELFSLGVLSPREISAGQDFPWPVPSQWSLWSDAGSFLPSLLRFEDWLVRGKGQILQILWDIISHTLFPCRNSSQSHLDHLDQDFPEELIYFDVSRA